LATARRIMKFSSLFLLALATSGVAASAQTTPSASGTKVYLRPSAAVIIPGDDFEVGAGGLIAFGVQFAGQHHLEVETGYLHSDIKNSSYSMEFIPAVINYKYTLSLSERFSLQAGITAGAMYQKLDLSSYGYGVTGETKSSAAFGLNAGARFKVTERLALDAGAKVLRIGETRYTTEGDVTIFHAGLNVRL
jgi:opacity protein-like surface antigen